IHGFGASIMSRGEVPQHPSLCALPFRQTSPLIYEYLYYLKDREKVPLIAAFLRHIEPLV
ncbi:MAG: LysR family transcriptional regulator, partial [Burkholderiales bacterium]|nr:LysR family transcriptional regulator [Burkholderiales bacterium]